MVLGGRVEQEKYFTRHRLFFFDAFLYIYIYISLSHFPALPYLLSLTSESFSAFHDSAEMIINVCLSASPFVSSDYYCFYSYQYQHANIQGYSVSVEEV